MLGNRKGLRGGRENRYNREDINPMENVANLVDVMLVFACALMIAIITFWKVDISNIQQVDKEDLRKVDNLKESVQEKAMTDQYKSKGTVYEDPETGEMYIISN